MKIVIDARRLRTSTGRYSRQLLKYLQEIDTNNDYHVIVHKLDDDHWQPTAKNFTKHVVSYDHYTFGEQLGLAWFLYSLKADLVHFLMPQQPLLYFGRRVTTVHDLTLVCFKNLDKNRLVYAVEQTIFKFLLKNVARRSKTVIVPSQFVANDVAGYAKIAFDKIVVTYESAELPEQVKPQAVEALSNQEFLLYVGNATPHKNLSKLLDAFAELQQSRPQLHLALAGKKEFFYEQVEAYAKKLALNNVHFLDFVSEAELTWLYQNAQVYVYPSLSEGFGLPGLEAMAHELPVAASNATCLPEIYGQAAVYFDPHSPVDMAEKISNLLADKKQQARLVKAGTERLKQFSWRRMAQQTLAVYKNKH